MNKIQEEMDLMLEDALRTYPRAQTPRGFSSRVLQRIETAPRASLQFRLTWLDAALGLFAMLTPFVAILAWNSLPLTGLLRLRLSFSVFQSSPQFQPLILFLILGTAALIALIALAAFLFIVPFSPQKKSPGN